MRTAIIVIAVVAAAGVIVFLLARRRRSTDRVAGNTIRAEHEHTHVAVVPIEEPMTAGVGTAAPEAITHSLDGDAAKLSREI